MVAYYMIPGAVSGLMVVLAEASSTAGIVAFAAGVLVAYASVHMMSGMVNRRLARDYDEWVKAGRPERRSGERRGARFRRHH